VALGKISEHELAPQETQKGVPIKGWRKLITISLLFAASVPPSIEPQEAFKARELLQKDLHAYAGGDLVSRVCS
jgi:hypothetical protein